MNIRDLFNARRWADHDLAELEIDVVHRGAPDDRRTVEGARVQRITSAGLFVISEAEDDGEAFLPFQRVLEIRTPSGVLWTKP